jgi:hypothetical protein
MPLPDMRRLSFSKKSFDGQHQPRVDLIGVPHAVGAEREKLVVRDVSRTHIPTAPFGTKVGTGSDSLCYSCSYSSIWCLAILAVPLIPIMVVLAIMTQSTPLRWLYSTLGLLFLFYALYTRAWPYIRTQIRAGVWPMSVFDEMPTTERDLILSCRKAQKRGTLRIVGQAWSFYLGKRSAKGVRVWTIRYTGQKQNGRWRSGTPADNVILKLAEENSTLAQTPSLGGITIGSWIATCVHGHSGREDQSHLFNWLVSARVLHIESGVITDDPPTVLLDKFGSRAHDLACHLPPANILTPACVSTKFRLPY